MGITHYLVCEDCMEKIYAGKYLFNVDPDMLDDITEFPEELSEADKQYYRTQEMLLYITRGFLVKHSGHRISYMNDTYSKYDDDPRWKAKTIGPW